MYDNYYAIEYALKLQQNELEKRARFAWMQGEPDHVHEKLPPKTEPLSQKCCCPAV